MKNERMSLIVWSFPLSTYRVTQVCSPLLCAGPSSKRPTHIRCFLLPSLLLQETEVSSSKTAGVQMPTLIPVFDSVVEAKQSNTDCPHPSLHPTTLPPLHTCLKLLAMALSGFGDAEKKDGKLCQLLKAFYPLWIFGCRTYCGASCTKGRSEQGNAVPPSLCTSHGTVLWAPAPF